MKKIISSICLLLFVFTAIAQSQADIDKMMKQMQDVMKDLPPEAKQMMDSMGMKMPDASKAVLPKGMTINNIQQKQKEMIADDAVYRKKSLAEMPKKIFTDAELVTFLQNSFTKIDAVTSSKTRGNAQQIYSSTKARNLSVENSAITALMARRTGEALWILAKAAVENPENGNLLSNYSAVITMCEGAYLAIPVLNYLNNKYPNNSTILNNLGQAWYNMEKRDSAEKYLNLAIILSPYHSNANYTESKICEEKKDTARALKLLRNSLKYGCTHEKIIDIEKKTGKKLTKKDISWPFSDNPDPLDFDKITIPEYPMDVQSSELLEPNMKAFTAFWKVEAEKYEAKLKELMPIVQQKQQAMAAKVLQTKDDSPFELPFAEKAAIYYGQDISDGFLLSGKAFKDFADYKEDERKFQKEMEEKEIALDALMEKVYEGKCPGEGCPYSKYCPDYASRQNDISNSYLSKVNPKYDYVLNEQLKAAKLAFNANVNMALYSSTSDEQLEMAKVIAKAGFARALADISYTFINETPKDCGMLVDENGNYIGEMGDEDCNDKLSVGFGIGKVSVSCSSFTIEGGEFIQGSGEYNFRTGEYELGIGAGVTAHLGAGPVIVEGGGKELVIFHFNSSGKLTDAGVKASVGIEGRLGAATIGAERSVTATINNGIKLGSERSLGVKY